MLPFSDSFTGPDGQALTVHNAGYVNVVGLAELFSNAAVGTILIDRTVTAWAGDVFQADQYAQGLLAGPGGAGRAGVAVRCGGAGSNTFYAFYNYIAGPFTRLIKVVAGVGVGLAAPGPVAAPGDVLRLEVSGNTLTPYVNGVVSPIGPIVDVDIVAGTGGVYFFDDDPDDRLEDFITGDLNPIVVSPSLYPLGVL